MKPTGRSASRPPILAALAVTALAIVVLSQLRIVLDISAFMLDGGENEQIRLSSQLAGSELTRTLIVLVEAPDEARAREATLAIEAELKRDPVVTERVEAIDGGPPDGFEASLWQLYQPRSLGFVAASTTAAAAAVSPTGLARAFDDLLERLRSPMSTLVAKVAPEDPLLVFPRLFDRLAMAQQGGLRIADGRYVSRDGRRGVLFIRTKASAFNGGAHAPVLTAIRAAFDRASTGDLRLQLGGLHRFAVRIERSIKADIARVSVLSTVGLILLFVALFRSLRVVALTLCILTVGLVCGLAATLAVFGRVHGLTLAFGASMIGVSIDYSVHFFVHHTLAPTGQPPQTTLRRIWPGLVLGAATTVAGFAGLGGAGLPGLREVAVFASAGIVGALSATWLFLPSLVGAQPFSAVAAPAAAALTRAIHRLARAPQGVLWMLPAGVVSFAALGLPAARWDDDVASLTHLDPELVAEEEAVRAQVAPFEQRRFVVARGATAEDALQANERVAKALEGAVQANELGGFRSLAPFLPSAESQRAVAATVRRHLEQQTVRRLAVDRGFRADAFAPFFQRLRGPDPEPLTLDDLRGTALANLGRTFSVGLDEGFGVLTFLIDVRAPEALAARINRTDGAVWFDQGLLYRDANRQYRERTVWGLGLGLLVVIALVALRYRRGWDILAAVAPASLAVAVTIAALGAAGLPLNIVALTALLMVFSMGVDYGVFLAETARHGWDDANELGATLLAVTIAWASTLLGFGLLALSSHPAMRTIGLTASIGVTSSLLLAPTALLLARPRRSSARGEYE